MNRRSWERRILRAAARSWCEPAESLRVRWWGYYHGEPSFSVRAAAWSVRVEDVQRLGQTFLSSPSIRRAAVNALVTLTRQMEDTDGVAQLARPWPELKVDEVHCIAQGLSPDVLWSRRGVDDYRMLEHLLYEYPRLP